MILSRFLLKCAYYPPFSAVNELFVGKESHLLSITTVLVTSTILTLPPIGRHPPFFLMNDLAHLFAPSSDFLDFSGCSSSSWNFPPCHPYAESWNWKRNDEQVGRGQRAGRSDFGVFMVVRESGASARWRCPPVPHLLRSADRIEKHPTVWASLADRAFLPREASALALVMRDRRHFRLLGFGF